MIGHGLKCEYSLSEAIGQLIIWTVLSILTLGLAVFVMPYYFFKGAINKTYVVDQNGNKLAKLHVDVNLSEIVGHLFVWILLTIVTLGLAYLVFWPAVLKKILSGVVYQSLEQPDSRFGLDTGPIISTP